MTIVDHNWPENREYKSNKYKLDFKWSPASKIPQEGRVEFADGTIRVFPPSSQWNDLEEAYKDVIVQIEDYKKKFYLNSSSTKLMFALIECRQ